MRLQTSLQSTELFQISESFEPAVHVSIYKYVYLKLEKLI